jgi:hypothetical protein
MTFIVDGRQGELRLDQADTPQVPAMLILQGKPETYVVPPHY